MNQTWDWDSSDNAILQVVVPRNQELRGTFHCEKHLGIPSEVREHDIQSSWN